MPAPHKIDSIGFQLKMKTQVSGSVTSVELCFFKLIRRLWLSCVYKYINQNAILRKKKMWFWHGVAHACFPARYRRSYVWLAYQLLRAGGPLSENVQPRRWSTGSCLAYQRLASYQRLVGLSAALAGLIEAEKTEPSWLITRYEYTRTSTLEANRDRAMYSPEPRTTIRRQKKFFELQILRATLQTSPPCLVTW